MKTETTKHTPGPWIVGDMGHDTSIEAQVQQLQEGEGTDREWTAVGICDEDGFAEVVALTHPSNAPLVAAAPDLLNALRAVKERRICWPKEIEEQVNSAIAKAEGR